MASPPLGLSEYLQMKQKYTVYNPAVASPSCSRGSLYSYEVNSEIRHQQDDYFYRMSQQMLAKVDYRPVAESAEASPQSSVTRPQPRKVSRKSRRRRIKKAKTVEPYQDLSPASVSSIELPQRSSALYSQVNKYYRQNTVKSQLESLQRNSSPILRRSSVLTEQ